MAHKAGFVNIIEQTIRQKLPKGFQAVKAITTEAASATQDQIQLDD